MSYKPRTDMNDLIARGIITPTGMIIDNEKDQSHLDPDYVPPVYIGLDYMEEALVNLWTDPAGYTWMEKWLQLQGMKHIAYMGRRENIELLQMICMYFHYEEMRNAKHK